jgi:hypothetical protein
MKKMIFEGTKYAPRIELNPEGEIKIEGRCIIDDVYTYFSPVFRWIKTCTFNTVTIEIKLEFVNTNGVKQIYNFLTLVKRNYYIKNAYINWFFEEGDEGCLEIGKTLESQINIPFNYYEYSLV